jgi:recombination protein RecT
MSTQLTTKQFFAHSNVKSKFEELLGKRSNQFITSVLQVVSNNTLLSKASPESIYNCACVSATLDLPINNSLGFAWIVPYGNSAQFQIGWKGFVQLAQRTGAYKAINVIEIYENQFVKYNRLTESLDADFTIEGKGNVVGYVSYFCLLNGFEKTVYWTVEEVRKHAIRFSKTYNSTNSVWKSDFDAMAKKTVIKNTLSKWGILSIEMQIALKTDQGIIKDSETFETDYVDATNQNTIQLNTISNEHLEEALKTYSIEQIQAQYQLTEEQILHYGK